MKLLIFIGGIYHAGFAVFHIFFWKLFGWNKDLRSLSLINRSVMQILNLRLIFVFLVVAYLSLFHAEDLLTSRFGNVILLAVALFWLMRAIEQIIFFGLRRTVSMTIFLIFLFGTAIYIYPILF